MCLCNYYANKFSQTSLILFRIRQHGETATVSNIEKTYSQLTVNGVDGPVGQGVLSVVEVVKGQGQARAPIQRLRMAVKRV